MNHWRRFYMNKRLLLSEYKLRQRKAEMELASVTEEISSSKIELVTVTETREALQKNVIELDRHKLVSLEEPCYSDCEIIPAGSESLTESLELMQQAFGSPGGKSRVAQKIIDVMPEHKTYVEGFAGGAAVYWKKEPSDLEVLNDFDEEIAGAYEFIKNVTEEQVKVLESKNWAADQKLWKKLMDQELGESPIENFYKFLYTNYHSYGKSRKSFGHMPDTMQSKICSRLMKLKGRMTNTFVNQGSYVDMVEKYDSPETFFYLDPPYPGEWPGPTGADAWGEKHVKEMVHVLSEVKGKYMVSINNLPWIAEEFRKVESNRLNKLKVPRSFRKGDTAKYELLITNYDIGSKKKVENKEATGLNSVNTANSFDSPESAVSELFKIGNEFAVCKRYNGLKVLVEKIGNKVSIVDYSGKDITSHFNNVVYNAKQLCKADYLMECTIAQYNGKKPVELCELDSKNFDESSVIFHISDLMSYDGSITELSWVDRRKILESKNLKMTCNFNIAPAMSVSNEDEALKAIKLVSCLRGSIGAIVKNYLGKYSSDVFEVQGGN